MIVCWNVINDGKGRTDKATKVALSDYLGVDIEEALSQDRIA